MQLDAYRYRFPFKEPFITGSSTYRERKGIILVLEADGIRALGEAAPLPGFSRETLEEVAAELLETGEQIHDRIREAIGKNDRANPVPFEVESPSLGFALDTLLNDFFATAEGIPLRKFLFNKSRRSLPVNTTLPAAGGIDLIDRARELWEQGYRSFKLKLGRAIEREITTIEQLRSTFPEIRLRIDANRCWNPAEALRHLKELEPFEIEYCEEPLKKPDVDTLRSLQKQTNIPVALDESLHQLDGPEQLIRKKAGQVVIIKPMVFGRLQKIFETYRLAVTHDYKPVFTTSLESGIGRMMTATLASGLGSPLFAHGLATGGLLSMDVWHDRTYIDSGYFILPDDLGLGKKRRPGLQDLGLEPIAFY